MSEYDFSDRDFFDARERADEERIDVRDCYECNGRGWIVTCPDDMCHGRDECIHGDPPKPCPLCNPSGLDVEGYFA